MNKRTIIAFISGALIGGLICIPIGGLISHIQMVKSVVKTQMTMTQIEAAIFQYHKKSGTLPSSLKELSENDQHVAYILTPIVDAWGNKFQYKPAKSDQNSYEISSYGADNQSGGILDCADITKHITLPPAG